MAEQIEAVNDAAAALTLVLSDVARGEMLDRLATVRAWANVGTAPQRTGMAVIDSARRVLQRAELQIGDITLWETMLMGC